jgi:hypothetical protein
MHLVLLRKRLPPPGLFVYVVYMYTAYTLYTCETLRPFITDQPIQTSRQMINHHIERDIVTYYRPSSESTVRSPDDVSVQAPQLEYESNVLGNELHKRIVNIVNKRTETL